MFMSLLSCGRNSSWDSRIQKCIKNPTLSGRSQSKFHLWEVSRIGNSTVFNWISDYLNPWCLEGHANGERFLFGLMKYFKADCSDSNTSLWIQWPLNCALSGWVVQPVNYITIKLLKICKEQRLLHWKNHSNYAISFNFESQRAFVRSILNETTWSTKWAFTS